MGHSTHLRISCVNGCYVTWKAQPDRKLIKALLMLIWRLL